MQALRKVAPYFSFLAAIAILAIVVLNVNPSPAFAQNATTNISGPNPITMTPLNSGTVFLSQGVEELPVGGQTINLQQNIGSHWVTTQSQTTDYLNGWVRFSIPQGIGVYRFTYDGNPRFSPQVSSSYVELR